MYHIIHPDAQEFGWVDSSHATYEGARQALRQLEAALAEQPRRSPHLWYEITTREPWAVGPCMRSRREPEAMRWHPYSEGYTRVSAKGGHRHLERVYQD